MAKTTLPGAEMIRYFSPLNHALISVRDDGTSWGITMSNRTWKKFATKKADVPFDKWMAGKFAKVATLPPWALKVKSLPSMAKLSAWAGDSVCETVTGDDVEPDGIGPDGAPSWLLALGMI